MSKMAEIDQEFKDLSKRINRLETVFICILIILAVFILRQWNIRQRLIKQENYMHQVEADIDNLYRSVE